MAVCVCVLACPRCQCMSKLNKKERSLRALQEAGKMAQLRQPASVQQMLGVCFFFFWGGEPHQLWLSVWFPFQSSKHWVPTPKKAQPKHRPIPPDGLYLNPFEAWKAGHPGRKKTCFKLEECGRKETSVVGPQGVFPTTSVIQGNLPRYVVG